MSAFDVLVVGGGPGGSIASTRLAQAGKRVLVLEKEHFPRFHLGESLLPQSLPILASVGVLDAVKDQFIWKYGARFHDDVRNRKDRFCFADAWKADPIHAFQVERSKFDHLLLKNAAAKGVEVREGWSVKSAIQDDGRVIGVVALDPEGHEHRILASTVVDATGRDALFAHDHRATTKIEGLEQTAIFAHFENIARQPGQLEGDIDVVLFRTNEGEQPNWFWIIPFKDGVTSVGAVVSKKWIRDRRTESPDLTALLNRAIAESPSATALMQNSKMIWPEARSAADFSYRVGGIHGPGWIAIGDAAGFIDPLFSTGAHLAMSGATLAADAILEGTPEAFERWEKSLRNAAETFIVAVRCFYTGPLVDMLFMENKHVALRRSITSLLAGDVFHDSIWIRDARKRLGDLIPPSPIA